MARVRLLRISNFRGISSLEWRPSPGVNCLIGPGDAGKSSILDAIDLCAGARRNAQFCDADFHGLNTSQPIVIEASLGELPDHMRSIEPYGQFVRGWDAALGELADEPGAGLETVLTLRLSVAADLEPAWSLVSDRAAAQGLTRNLAWADRVRLAPMRIGGSAHANLGWRRGVGPGPPVGREGGRHGCPRGGGPGCSACFRRPSGGAVGGDVGNRGQGGRSAWGGARRRRARLPGCRICFVFRRHGLAARRSRRAADRPGHGFLAAARRRAATGGCPACWYSIGGRDRTRTGAAPDNRVPGIARRQGDGSASPGLRNHPLSYRDPRAVGGAAARRPRRLGQPMLCCPLPRTRPGCRGR